MFEVVEGELEAVGFLHGQQFLAALLFELYGLESNEIQIAHPAFRAQIIFNHIFALLVPILDAVCAQKR